MVSVGKKGWTGSKPRLGFHPRSAALCLMLALYLGVVSGCGGAEARSVHYGTYVGHLCEAIGPFEQDGQAFGKVLSRYSLALKSRRSRLEITDSLTAVITDTRHVITTLKTVGAPDIENGRVLARAVISAFDKIGKSDITWRSELRAGVWSWPSTSRAKRERVRTSVGALVLVGREIQRLPRTRERESAMASSPVCRETFGSVRADAGE